VQDDLKQSPVPNRKDQKKANGHDGEGEKKYQTDFRKGEKLRNIRRKRRVGDFEGRAPWWIEGSEGEKKKWPKGGRGKA